MKKLLLIATVLISSITFAQDCSGFDVEKDKFTGEVRHTAYHMLSRTSIVKVVRPNGDTSYYMKLKANGSDFNVGLKGLKILLKNGEIIEKPEVELDVEHVVDTSVGVRSIYIYSAFIELTESDIDLLTQHKITDVRLYVYDAKTMFPGKILKMLKCITGR